eukprot:67450_1
MLSFCFLALSLILWTANCETITCSKQQDCRCVQNNACIINCIGEDYCKASSVTLTCKSARPCTIKCIGTATCADAYVDGSSATDLTVICNGKDSCKGDKRIVCGSGDCSIQCYKKSGGDTCNKQIDTNNARSFQCTGTDCPIHWPAPYSPAPTPTPSSPTPEPTNRPTFGSFPLRTPRPTNRPTPRPTETPTQLPTKTPSYDPTITPTFYPTNSPTFYPTIAPTFDPTNAPTFDPTNAPTFDPTNPPTLNPTNTPTLYPTNNPSSFPSNNPTIVPTHDPSINPTIVPSEHPIADTTSNPTVQTTATTRGAFRHGPIYHPTTVMPSTQPSNEPSVEPSDRPSHSPTRRPSLHPSINPTTRIPVVYPWKLQVDIADTTMTNAPDYGMTGSINGTGMMIVSDYKWHNERNWVLASLAVGACVCLIGVVVRQRRIIKQLQNVQIGLDDARRISTIGSESESIDSVHVEGGLTSHRGSIGSTCGTTQLGDVKVSIVRKHNNFGRMNQVERMIHVSDVSHDTEEESMSVSSDPDDYNDQSGCGLVTTTYGMDVDEVEAYVDEMVYGNTQEHEDLSGRVMHSDTDEQCEVIDGVYVHQLIQNYVALQECPSRSSRTRSTI